MSIPICWPDLAKTLEPEGAGVSEDLRHENRKSLTQCLREVVGIEKPAVWALKKPTWEFSHRARPKPVAGRQGPRMGHTAARRRNL